MSGTVTVDLTHSHRVGPGPGMTTCKMNHAAVDEKTGASWSMKRDRVTGEARGASRVEGVTMEEWWRKYLRRF